MAAKKKDEFATTKKTVILEEKNVFAHSNPLNCTSNPLPIHSFMVTQAHVRS